MGQITFSLFISYIYNDFIRLTETIPDDCLMVNLTLSLCLPCWTGDNTDLPWNSHISLRVNMPSQARFLKNI